MKNKERERNIEISNMKINKNKIMKEDKKWNNEIMKRKHI